MQLFEVGVEDEGQRADVVLARLLGSSRAEAQRLLEGGHALVNGKAARHSLRPKLGDTFAVELPEVITAELAAEQIPLDVRYEDEHLMVINKPRGMVVHPSAGHSGGTLVNAVLAHASDLSGIGGEERPGIVHRLDKDTSGLLVVAKSDAAHKGLQEQIQAHTAERIYTAVVWGSPTFAEATVDAPIGRNPQDRKKMAVITDRRQRSREAVTHLSVLERLGPFTVLQAKLTTGRTHQIRVHCQYAKFPVVADPLYGGVRRLDAPQISSSLRDSVHKVIDALGGQALHAGRLSFTHPVSGERIEIEAEPDAPLTALLEVLRKAFGSVA